MQITRHSLPLLNPEPRTLNPTPVAIIRMILPWQRLPIALNESGRHVMLPRIARAHGLRNT